jgi:hypothetical protein
MVFVSPSKSTGSYGGGAPANPANGQVQFATQQDNWGYEVTAKPRFDARTETSVGTLRAYIELKIQLDAGAFNGPPGPGAGDTGAGNKTELYRAYAQWAGWTIGNGESIWSLGGMKDADVADVVLSDKSSGWTVNYTWTPTGPGVPPVKGSAPVPDGWSLALGMDSPLKHIAKQQVGGGCTYYDVVIAAGNPLVGAGNVCAATGPLSVPDFVARLHYEADPPGKDDQHNDQFGLGTFHAAAAWHQITQIAVGGSGLLAAPVTGCGSGTCALGPVNHDNGWAAQTAWRFYVPMLPGAKLGANRSSNADNIQFNFLYCEAALEYCGLGGSNGNFSAGDAYWSGGLSRDDTDGRIVNNGFGGFYVDKAKMWSFNAQYHAILTDCTDPVHCLALTLHYNLAQVTPGNVTQNVDWTEGGLGKAYHQYYTAEISWGVSRNGSTRPVFWRADFEVQYAKLNANLPNNCNGGGPSGVCAPASLIPLGITKDPSNWVTRATITFDY